MPRLIASILLAATLSGCVSRPLPPAHGPMVVEVDPYEFERLTPRERSEALRVGERRARCTAAFARAGVSGARTCR